jgi:hypothetical protein
MTALVLAEHDNHTLRPSTLNTVTAAAKAGGQVHVFVVGHNAADAAQQAAKIGGVSKVLLADAPQFANGLAEPVAAQVAAVAGSYSTSWRRDRVWQEHPAAGCRQARRSPDIGHHQCRVPGHVHAADLCGQRDRDGPVDRQDQGHHCAPDQFRGGTG